MLGEGLEKGLDVCLCWKPAVILKMPGAARGQQLHTRWLSSLLRSILGCGPPWDCLPCTPPYVGRMDPSLIKPMLVNQIPGSNSQRF